MLHFATRIGEAEIDEFNIVLLNHIHYASHIGHVFVSLSVIEFARHGRGDNADHCVHAVVV
jgi:hypothetical protein